MSHIVYQAGTVIPSTWLNDVDTVVYTYFGNGTSFNSPTKLTINSVITTAIDSGTTGSLSLKTNNGSEEFRAFHVGGTLVNVIGAGGSITGTDPFFQAAGTDATVGMRFFGQGNTPSFNFFNGPASQQFQILSTVSSNRWVTVTGSNSGNPTIGTSGGNLAVSSSLVITGVRLQGAYGANIASANQLTLGTDGNIFGITGTTQINLISNVGWQSGSIVTLQSRSATFTVKENQAASGNFRPLILSGGTDFAMSNNNTLTLVFDGLNNFWVEVGRGTG